MQDNLLKKRVFTENEQIAISAYFGDDIEEMSKSIKTTKNLKHLQVYKLDTKSEYFVNHLDISKSFMGSPSRDLAVIIYIFNFTNSLHRILKLREN